MPTVPTSAGIPNLGRPDPNWGNISRFESSGNSYYDGMVVSFNKRASRWATVRASYTLSKTIDDSGNFFFSSVQNNFNIRDDRGLSDNDQRHRLVLSGSIEAPEQGKTNALRGALRGFQFGYIFTYGSRLPFNVLFGSDRNLDTNNNDRPLGVGRNTGRGFDFASLDLRVSRKFRLTERVDLQLLAEGFNVLNRANLSVCRTTRSVRALILWQASDNQPRRSIARQFQFGMRFSF